MPLFILLAYVAYIFYNSGLPGTFQFDDFANLPALGTTGPIDNWPTFWRYITSGTADPTGRPVALLSFLVDAHNWPASPRPFLRTSILLHLFNGFLLFWLLRQLGRMATGIKAIAAMGRSHKGFKRFGACPVGAAHGRDNPALALRIELAALLGAAFWLLHPLFVSTTLYIVQREAMLPATFTLLGLLAWLQGRGRIRGGATWRGLAWMVLGLGACTALGVLSKANGILLPALALVIEWVLLRCCETPANRGHGPLPQKSLVFRGTPPAIQESVEPPVGAAHGRDGAGSPQHRVYRLAMWVLAGIPTVFVAGYLLHAGYRGLVHGISSTRPWTLGERLLTEPRVLMDYLQLLWLPRPFTAGLFNDQIAASTSLFSPWTTLPSLFAVLGLIVAAVLMRRRWPALAAAVLFYFVGQSLESSTVALELYFEHRNYLPALLMFWPLALWLCGVRLGRAHSADGNTTAQQVPSRGATVLKAALAVVLVAGLGAMTHARASVWGNTHDQALLWATLNPESPRARANAAMAQMHAGHADRAIPQLRRLLAQNPEQVQLAFNLVAAECSLGNVTPETLAAARTALATTRNPGALLTSWFNRAIGQTSHPRCPQMTLDTLEAFADAAQSNPKLMAIRGRKQDLDSIRGRIALARGNPDQALNDFNLALEQDVRISAALEQAAQLGAHGYPRRGLAHLDHFTHLNAHHPHKPGFGMPRIHAWVLARQSYWRNEMDHLRHTLEQDATK